MTEIPNFVLQVIISLAGAVGVYAGIRADLAHLKANSDHQKEQLKFVREKAKDAHDRITGHIEAHHMKRSTD